MTKGKRKPDDELRRISPVGKRFKCKQIKAREYLLTGVYIDVHEQNKTERNAELRRISIVFQWVGATGARYLNSPFSAPLVYLSVVAAA